MEIIILLLIIIIATFPFSMKIIIKLGVKILDKLDKLL